MGSSKASAAAAPVPEVGLEHHDTPGPATVGEPLPIGARASAETIPQSTESVTREPPDASALLEIIPSRLVSKDTIACNGSLQALPKLVLDVGARPRALYCKGAEPEGTRWLSLNSDPSVTCG